MFVCVFVCVFVFAIVFVCVFACLCLCLCVCDISCHVDTLLAGVQEIRRFCVFKDESGSSAPAQERSDTLNEMWQVYRKSDVFEFSRTSQVLPL